ncbi:MAG: lysylphosphatidylglycerol synthase transmembrane domain-containing protein [Acidimicrobiales bacterium]
MADDTPPAGGTKVASTLAGLVIGGGAAASVLRALLRDRDEIGEAVGDSSVGWLVLGLVLAAAGMTLMALPWRRALNLMGADLPWAQVLARYFAGEIGKYLPGGIWPIVGRAELARRYGVARTSAYGSVVLSLLALYLAGMLVAGVGLPITPAGDDGVAPAAVLLLLPLGLGVLHPLVLRRALAVVERVTRRAIDLEIPEWRSSVSLVLLYVPPWLFVGGATWAVARALDPDARLVPVAAAAVLSWVIGFVVVPVPGGIGVREAAFVAAAASLDPGVAATVALVARALFVTVDAGAAALGSATIRRARSRNSATGAPLRRSHRH